MHTYATLNELKQHLGQDVEVSDDNLLTLILNASTSIIDTYQQRGMGAFLPRVETILHNYPHGEGEVSTLANIGNAFKQSNYYRLPLQDYLLQLTSVTNGDGDAIATSDIIQMPQGIYPKIDLIIDKSANTVWEKDSNGNVFAVISVTGVWGFHRNYSNAWVNTLDTVDNAPLSAAGTTINVQDADGMANDFLSPKFQEGQLLRLGTSSSYEFVYVKEVDVDADTLTVIRGYRGSTAAEWAQGTAINVFRPDFGINMACIEISKELYRRKDSDDNNVQQILGSAVKIMPHTIPSHIAALMPAPTIKIRDSA